jgi:hypothetical protein
LGERDRARLLADPAKTERACHPEVLSGTQSSSTSAAVSQHRSITHHTMAVANGDNAAPSTELDVKPPENIVIPPATVRVHVGKTAEFVFRRGDQLLQTLKQRIANESKSQITFVLDDDPYNPYFMWYLEQLRAGHGPTAKSAAPVVEKPKGPPEPAKFRFSARMPNISAKDLEVLYTQRALGRTG